MITAENVFQLNPETTPAEPAPELVPPPSAPVKVARLIHEEQIEAGQHLLRWRGDWWAYVGPHWAIVDPEALRKGVYNRLENAQYAVKGKGDEPEVKPWNPDTAKVNKVVDAMVSLTLLPQEVDAGTHLPTRSPAALIPMSNGLLDPTNRAHYLPSPDLFFTYAVPVHYTADAPEPTEWLKFLRSIWPDDGAEEITALQEWVGYLLSGRTDLQKMVLLVGPPRSGKGTIGRVLKLLMGAENVVSPTLASLGQNFGLWPWIGKTLALIGDARLHGKGQDELVERLLSISGEDSLTIDRKHQQPWSGRLGARVMLLSNELPRFGDASGAIASRFIVLKMTKSYLGSEDIELDDRLRAELPGILLWALAGLDRVREQRRLSEPTTSLEAKQQLEELVSPIKAFIREVVEVDVTASTPFARVYEQYQQWCLETGRHAKNQAGFSSDLSTAQPELKTDHRPRDANGTKMPRHIKGLRVSSEWTNRVKDYGQAFATMPMQRQGQPMHNAGTPWPN